MHQQVQLVIPNTENFQPIEIILTVDLPNQSLIKATISFKSHYAGKLSGQVKGEEISGRRNIIQKLSFPRFTLASASLVVDGPLMIK